MSRDCTSRIDVAYSDSPQQSPWTIEERQGGQQPSYPTPGEWPGESQLLGALGRIRTCDTRFRKPLLYPLSYEGGDSQASGGARCGGSPDDENPVRLRSEMSRLDDAEVALLGELLVQPSATTVRLHGELDLVTADALRALLAEAAAEKPAKVVVDITDVPFVDVISLSTILAAADAMREREAPLIVVGASQSVRRLFQVLNAEDVLAPALPMPRIASS